MECVVVVRLYADAPSATADGWEALWFQPPQARAAGSYRDAERDSVIEWARATGVAQIMVEDAGTRTFSVLS